MNEQIEKLQRYEESNMEGGGVAPDCNGSYVKYKEVQAAIASQAPRQALTDAEIVEICEKECGWLAGAKDSEIVKFARAIEAASGPNAALVAALRKIERNEQVVFDEDTNCDVIVSMGTDDMIEIARAALAAVGVEP